MGAGYYLATGSDPALPDPYPSVHIYPSVQHQDRPSVLFAEETSARRIDRVESRQVECPELYRVLLSLAEHLLPVARE